MGQLSSTAMIWWSNGTLPGGRNWIAQQQGYVGLRKAFDQDRGTA